VYATYRSADVPRPAQNLCLLADLGLCHFDCLPIIVAGGGCGPNRLPGQLEHFAAYAVSAAIAMVGKH
jgi:hypothetical protein